MCKKTVTFLFAAILLMAVTTATASAASGTVYKWRLGSMYNDPKAVPEFNGFGHGIQKFIDLVGERTNGRVKITSYWSGVLGGDVELFNLIRDGELDVFYGSPMSNVDVRFAVTRIPYLFKNFDAVKKIYASPDAPMFKLMHETVGKYKCELISVGTGTFRGFINNKHEVVKVEDLSDLTCRVYEDYIVKAFWSKITNATIMPYSEVYTALQTKAIDGVEFAETIVVQDKCYEVTNHFTDLNWQWVGHQMMVSQKKWKELPADLQEIVRQAAWDAMAYEFEVEEGDRAKAYDAMRKHGMKVRLLTDAERQGWIDYARKQDDFIRKEIGDETFNKVIGWAKE